MQMPPLNLIPELILARRRLRLHPLNPLHQTPFALIVAILPALAIMRLAFPEAKSGTQCCAVGRRGPALGTVPVVVVH